MKKIHEYNYTTRVQYGINTVQATGRLSTYIIDIVIDVRKGRKKLYTCTLNSEMYKTFTNGISLNDLIDELTEKNAYGDIYAIALIAQHVI